MHKFSKGFYIKTAIASAVILIVMALSTLLDGNAGVITNVTNIVMQPIQKCASTAFEKVAGFADAIVNSGKYASENELLKSRLSHIEGEYADWAEIGAENERLRALLDMKTEKSEMELFGATVTSIVSDNWYNVISIDKGSADGVKVNDVVMTSQGLVGTVYEVGTTWAKVREIIDVESSISAVCAEKGYRGVAEGDYNLAPYGQCRLSYVPKNSNMVVGDRIEISDTGSVYSKGVYIGKVVEVYDNEDGLTLSAIIESEVNFNALSEVLVGRTKD